MLTSHKFSFRGFLGSHQIVLLSPLYFHKFFKTLLTIFTYSGIFLVNPTDFVDWSETIHKMWSCSFWTLPHRGLSLKDLPPRNTPDSFCRRFTRQNHRCAAWAVFFFSGKPYLENFMSRPNVIPDFQPTPLQNRGRNFVRSKRWLPYMSSTTSTYFLRLNNSETITENTFWAQR